MKAKAATLRTGQLLHLATYQPLEFNATDEVTNCLRRGTEHLYTINLVQRMAREAKAKCPVLKSFLEGKNTAYERPVAAYIEKLDLYVKVKPDAMLFNRSNKPTYLHDLKSTACNNRAAFLDTFKTYGYWRQTVLYKAATGAKNMFFTGVSKSEPHQIWTINTADYKPELKRAKAELLDIFDTYLQLNSKHAARCQQFLESIKNA
jgi:hypothetical protein